MGKGNRKQEKSQGRFTWAQAWRDVMFKAIASGQIVPTSIAIVMMIAAWRMPEQDLSPLVNRILNGLENHSLIGWIAFAIALCVWCWHASWMRRGFSKEFQRMGNEKTKHQQARTAQPLGTSD